MSYMAESPADFGEFGLSQDVHWSYLQHGLNGFLFKFCQLPCSLIHWTALSLAGNSLEYVPKTSSEAVKGVAAQLTINKNRWKGK